MNDRDEEIESALLGFRPTGPAAGLRSRVLSAAPPRESLGLRLWRYAAAAAVLVSISLFMAAERMDEGPPGIAAGPPPLPPEAQTAVAVLGGDENARKYVSMTLALERRRNGGPQALKHLSELTESIP